GSEAREVGAAVVQRYALSTALEQSHTWRNLRVLQHAGARVDASHKFGIADDVGGGPSHQSRARADIDHSHSGLEPGAPQSLPAIPGPCAETDERFQSIVVGRRAVEYAAHPVAPVTFVIVVAAQGWMRSHHSLVCASRKQRELPRPHSRTLHLA